MGRPFYFAPPAQATGSANLNAVLPDPIELPSMPEGGGMPELTPPTFKALTLPSATDAAMADLPDIPAVDVPDIFGL